jgi:hypothetical protein
MKQSVIVTMAYFKPIKGSDDENVKYEISYIKQLSIYKNVVFELNEVYGIDSHPCSKEE